MYVCWCVLLYDMMLYRVLICIDVYMCVCVHGVVCRIDVCVVVRDIVPCHDMLCGVVCYGAVCVCSMLVYVVVPVGV